MDYGDLAPLKQYIDATLNHQFLNNVFDFQTTAENIACHLFNWCKGVWPETAAVSVSETAKTWAIYTDPPPLLFSLPADLSAELLTQLAKLLTPTVFIKQGENHE